MNSCVKVLVVIITMGLWGVPAGADQHRLALSLGAGERYNDNIFFTRNGTIDDYITRLSGALTMSDRTERFNWLLSGRAVNQDYARHDELDDLDQYYKGRIGYWPTPHLKTTVDGSFSRDSQPDRDIEVTGMALGSANRDTQQYGASLHYDLTDITSSMFSYQYRDQNYEGDQYADYIYYQAGLGFTHRLDMYINNTTGRLNFNYAQYDYPTTKLDYCAATVGFHYQLTEVWHLLIDVGARYTESQFRNFYGQETNSGWGGVGALEFAYQGEYAAASLTASHDVGAASGNDGSVERTFALLDLNYRFAENVRAGLSSGCYLNKAVAGDLAVADTEENTVNLRPYLHVGLIDSLSLEFSHTYTQIRDNIFEWTRKRNVSLIKLVWEYPLME